MSSRRYTDLDLDHKKELLVNLKALLLAVRIVGDLTGDDNELWLNEIWRQAHTEVSSLSAKDVHSSIETIEENRRKFDKPGIILISFIR